jgi:hypothetical protein|nr:MAG TPA: Protein of unknown function (DUF1566) [Caudoviricetes sp.]
MYNVKPVQLGCRMLSLPVVGIVSGKAPAFTPCGVGLMLNGGNIVDLNDPAIKQSYSKDEVIGIALEWTDSVTGFDYALLITTEAPYSCVWGGWDAKCATLAHYPGINAALAQENDGEANTLKCIADQTLTNAGRAPMYCHKKIMNGKNCYLPAIGELRAIMHNIALINTALALCGASALPVDSWFWSSSLAERADNENVESHITYLFGYKYESDNSYYYEGLAVQGGYLALPIAKLY